MHGHGSRWSRQSASRMRRSTSLDRAPSRGSHARQHSHLLGPVPALSPPVCAETGGDRAERGGPPTAISSDGPASEHAEGGRGSGERRRPAGTRATRQLGSGNGPGCGLGAARQLTTRDSPHQVMVPDATGSGDGAGGTRTGHSPGQCRALSAHYRDPLLIINRLPLGPYSRALWWS